VRSIDGIRKAKAKTAFPHQFAVVVSGAQIALVINVK